MDRQKWIVCILIGVLLLVIAIPVDSKKQDAGTQESVQTTETESSFDTSSAESRSGLACFKK